MKKRIFFYHFIKKKPIHYFGSFDKNYILKSVKITFPKLINKIYFKSKKIEIFKFDNLKLNIKPHFIKIDVEGFDHFVIEGLKKTINKHKPVILIEYNVENFNKVSKMLKNYDKYIYDIKIDKLVKIKKNFFQKNIARTSKINLLSSRNIYFIPK